MGIDTWRVTNEVGVVGGDILRESLALDFLGKTIKTLQIQTHGS
ncbi:MAG TPA: hypothetical protein P5186_19955 [Candidatus Paceibacterota bacterium]|nr:hypothetical protein [Verrucomicrobiota bacterium]HRY50334.1 hypothetical protein [Candidatus Paceibacterota bacterium]